MVILGCGAELKALMDVSNEDVQIIEDVVTERLAMGMSPRDAQRQGVAEAIALLADERAMFMDALRDKLAEFRAKNPPKSEAPAPAVSQVTVDAPAAGPEIVEHVTKNGAGKTIRGVVRTDLTKAQAFSIDRFTFKKDGGFFIREEHLAALEAAHPAPVAPAPAPEVSQPTGTLENYFTTKIAAGLMPKDNAALKKLVAQFDGQEATPARMKVAQEALETAIVRAARIIASRGPIRGLKATYDALVALYDSQPLLNIRTSTSIENQAYSTPAPLAYVASRLAGITKKTTVLEPTAGNGMLLIEAATDNAYVNELNDDRAASLREQGFTVTQDDASAIQRNAPGSVDHVITNPPFGGMTDDKGDPVKVKIDGYSIGNIDHLIAARALSAMKDDGSAVLIIGANKLAGQKSNRDLIFFNWLYGNYNVTSHFEVDGALYSRQGASWPVRVITVKGRLKSSTVAPANGTIERATTWSEVYEQFQKGMDATGPATGSGPAVVGARSGTPNVGVPVPATPVSQAGRPDTGRPNGGAAGNGNVSGTGAGTVGDSPAVPAESVGERPGANGPDVVTPVGRGLVGGAGDGAAAKPARNSGTPSLADAENQFQAKYVPRSARKDEGVLIPVNMAGPTQDALNRLEDAVGDIDQFAMKELGYPTVEALHDAFMGLQVDSIASAIYQIKAGKGVIIADQTGIGKGRQAAAIIRWAALQGKTPVFVSVKPSLFTDMYGDLHDIGTDDIKPFILNKDAAIKGEGDARLFGNKPTTHGRAMMGIASSGALPKGSNALFMTYSQINVDNTQRRAVLSLAPNAVFVLDESHNAGGDSSTSEFVRNALGLSSGAVYLSATYAKRPDNMPVYFKTDIGDAVADDATLMEAMKSGGLPLQTVVSNNLVKAGQMFRRERSYDGVSIESRADTTHRAEHVTMSDATTLALRAIVQADKTFHNTYVKSLQEELEKRGEKVIDSAGNQSQASVDHTQFSSVVHNFVRQMLLGLKAQEAADDAIRSLKRGEKPLIAVENTMGSFLSEYAANNSLAVGDSLGNFTYRTVLTRALERSRYIIRQLPNGDKVKEYIPMSALDPESFIAYQSAQRVIGSLDIDIPVSPIDWMRNEITKAGFTVAEVTGRGLMVDYSDPKNPKLAQMDPTEKKDKVRTTRRFNGGTADDMIAMGDRLDALILNVAGSTGISLHASEKFADQRQRHMIVAQAAQDINIFMQMLGRVHRTGQVNLPKYTLLSADLPAEIRPTALLSGKMKSLNANTSSNTESATSVKSADMLNKYGDRVIGQYLADNAELADALGLDGTSEGGEVELDIARKATGRLALMPVKTQEAFYAEVEEQYQALIDYLNKTNQNELEPKTFDFDAQETKSAVLFEGQNKASPFGEDAVYGEYSVKAQGKAMTPAEIKDAIKESMGGKSTPSAHAEAMLVGLVPAYTAFRNKQTDAMKENAANQQRRSTQFVREHPIGSMFRVEINGDQYNAVVTNIRNTHKAEGNPYAMSKFQVTVALNGALRSVTVPATQFGSIETSSLRGYGTSIEREFREGPPNERETAKIVTGNLLGAYGEMDGARGSIITFTKQDGSTEQGILLPKAFNFAKDTRQDYRLKTPADVFTFVTQSGSENIDRFGINSRDSAVRVLPADDRQGIIIQVPKSKAKGGKFFLDKDLLAASGDFVSVGSFMRANVQGKNKSLQALEVLMKKQALYALPSMAEEARTILNDPAPSSPTAFSKSQSKPVSGQPVQQVQALVNAITARWKNAPSVVVVESLNDPRVPESVRKDAAKTAKSSTAAGGTPDGFFNDEDGKVYLIADRLGGDADTLRVLMHESLGHYGLRATYGEDLGAILDRIATLNASKVRAAASTLGLNFDNADERRLAAEEVLSYMAENEPELGWVKQAIAAVRTWLRDHVPGFSKMELTDAELIRNYILPARQFVIDGGPNGPGGRKSVTSDTLTPFSRAEKNAFDRWFDGSKVVNDAGEPLVVYHATAENFEEFVPGGTTRWLNGRIDPKGFLPSGKAIWFTSNAEHQPASHNIASRSNGFRDGTNVIPAYVKIKNPLLLDDQGMLDWAREVFAGGSKEFPQLVSEKIVAELKADGYDGIIYKPEGRDDEIIAFDATQVKSAIGNNGNYDPADARIAFSRNLGTALTAGMNNVRDVKLPAGYAVGDLIGSVPGRLGFWHKTVGTMYHLAQKSPPFKRVYDSVQNFLGDVSYYAAEAADLAPRILPKLDSWKDITKSPLSADDTKALSAPVFAGTLTWGRNEQGVAMPMDDIESSIGASTLDDKAHMLMRAGHIDPKVLRMWQGLPMEQYEAIINGKFETQFMKAGVVFTPAELRTHFSLTDDQIGLYEEFRKATDKSLDNLTASEMLRYAGKDALPIRDVVLEAASLDEAANTLRDYLLSLAEADVTRAEALTATANKMLEIAVHAGDLKKQGYAPLSRFGNYTLEATLETGERYFSLFETPRERARMERVLTAAGATGINTGTMSQEDYKLLNGISPETAALFGDMLGLESQGDEAKDLAFQEYVKRGVANRSAMKRLMHRKGIAGFSEDAGRVLAGFVYSNGRKTSSNLHTGEITNAVSAIPKEQGELKDAAVRLKEYVSNPQEEAQAFRAILFAQYLGGSVASAIVNASQPFAVTLPYLSQFGGIKKAAKQMARAANDATKALTGDARLDAALKHAEEAGIVSPQEVHALQAQAMGKAQLQSGDGTMAGDAYAGANNYLSKLSLAWGKVFGVAEQFNRRTTFIAAYRTAIDQGMTDPAKFAEKAVAETQFTYNKGNKPRWARGAVGSILFTFKQYSVNYVELLTRMATAGAPGSAERAAGQKAALLALAVLFLMAGADGLPFVEDIQDVIDGALQRMGYNFGSKQAVKEFLTHQIGKDGANFVMKGASGLPGAPIDFSGRLGMGNLIPGTGLFLKKTDHSRDLMEFAGAGGDLVKRGFTAAEQALKGDVIQAATTISPVAARNVAKAIDMGSTGMYRDDRGRKVIDTTIGEAFAKGVGFQPKNVAAVQEASFEVQRQKSGYVLASSEIREKWARSIFESDSAMLQDARDDIAAWNRKNPDQPMRANMPAIISRVKEMRKTKAQRVADTAPKAIREKARNQLKEELT